MSETAHRMRIDLSGAPRQTFENVFYRWALNVGKTVIVLVELIALGALFYRFYIDRLLVDQRDEIERQELLVRAQLKDINYYESIHERLEAVAYTSDRSDTTLEIVNAIREGLSDSTFREGDIVVNQNTVTFQGVSLSLFAINEFVEKLRDFPGVTALSLDEVSSASQGVRFVINVTLEGGVERL